MAGNKDKKSINKKNTDKRTFREVAEAWLADNKDNMATTTYDRYRETLERDVYPTYKNTPIKDITLEEMNRFLANAPEMAKKQGRTLKSGTLQIIRAVMSNVIQYAFADNNNGGTVIDRDFTSYETLLPEEIETICLRAKYNHCQELLAALLFIFCGIRNGEICGLSCDDIDLERMEIYIHKTVHRVSNPDKEARKKTRLVLEDIPRKKQVRKVPIPAVLKEYINEYMIPGRMLIRNKDGLMTDPRTLENKMLRIMDAFGLKNINPERMRMTYQKGKSDEQILTNIFLGIRPDRPYSGAMDMTWLTDEMTRDLEPLRLLVGLSHDEICTLLGISEDMYNEMENGRHGMSWDQYLALLFIFHYNGRTNDVVDSLGLFPLSLKEKIKLA